MKKMECLLFSIMFFNCSFREYNLNFKNNMDLDEPRCWPCVIILCRFIIAQSTNRILLIKSWTQPCTTGLGVLSYWFLDMCTVGTLATCLLCDSESWSIGKFIGIARHDKIRMNNEGRVGPQRDTLCFLGILKNGFLSQHPTGIWVSHLM